jgi:hypothetical protein
VSPFFLAVQGDVIMLRIDECLVVENKIEFPGC